MSRTVGMRVDGAESDVSEAVAMMGRLGLTINTSFGESFPSCFVSATGHLDLDVLAAAVKRLAVRDKRSQVDRWSYQGDGAATGELVKSSADANIGDAVNLLKEAVDLIDSVPLATAEDERHLAKEWMTIAYGFRRHVDAWRTHAEKAEAQLATLPVAEPSAADRLWCAAMALDARRGTLAGLADALAIGAEERGPATVAHLAKLLEAQLGAEVAK